MLLTNFIFSNKLTIFVKLSFFYNANRLGTDKMCMRPSSHTANNIYFFHSMLKIIISESQRDIWSHWKKIWWQIRAYTRILKPTLLSWESENKLWCWYEIHWMPHYLTHWTFWYCMISMFYSCLLPQNIALFSMLRAR